MSAAGEALKALIRRWMDESPDGRNVSLLARKSGLDYNTVSRAVNGKNPECQTALALLNVVCSKEDGIRFLREFFPHAAKFHEKQFSTPTFSDTESLRPLIGNYLSFLLLSLAYSGLATRSHIQKFFGDMGLDAAETLVTSGKFIWQNDSLQPSSPEDFFTFESKEDVVKACEHIVQLSAGSTGYPVALIGSLNDDEHERFKGLIREFCGATKDLVYNSKGKGRHLVTLATVYASLSNGDAK